MGKRKREGLQAADPLDGARQAAATIRDHGEATAATFAALAEEAAQTQQRIKTEVEKMTTFMTNFGTTMTRLAGDLSKTIGAAAKKAAAEGQKCAGKLDRLCDEVGAAFQTQDSEAFKAKLHNKA